jgi:hypothetical protein
LQKLYVMFAKSTLFVSEICNKAVLTVF